LTIFFLQKENLVDQKKKHLAGESKRMGRGEWK